MKTQKRIITVILCGLICGTGYSGFGFDNPGHMAVAGLAYDELSNSQQDKLVSVLRQHPGVDLIKEGFPGGRSADRDFVMAAATWPDLAKRSKAYTDNGYEADQPAVTE